jgi:hypothetical protein
MDILLTRVQEIESHLPSDIKSHLGDYIFFQMTFL